VNALVVHAHPDDELLFAGALMEARPDWNWLTVSLTGGMRAAKYPGVSLGMPDEWRILSVPEYREWRNAVAGLGLKADVILTHNRLGEYGHPHHMTVHKIAHELYGPVWDFYVEAESSVGPQIAPGPITEIPVTEAKGERFRDTYGEAVLEELWRDRPELLAEVFRTERFTGPEVLM
jgi:hypothetical protein